MSDEWTNKFDVVIDKATLDSILCSEEGAKRVHEVLRSITQVELSWLLFSFGFWVTLLHARHFRQRHRSRSAAAGRAQLLAEKADQLGKIGHRGNWSRGCN